MKLIVLSRRVERERKEAYPPEVERLRDLSAPPYTSKVLSDSQIDDIYAFLKTIPGPPAVKDIPLLNQ